MQMESSRVQCAKGSRLPMPPAMASQRHGDSVEPPTELVRHRPAPQPHSTAYLTVLHGNHVGGVFELAQGDNVIGRAQRATVRLTDTGISREHAKVVRDADGAVKLVDLGSTNGTFINSRRIHAEGLRDGDRIRIGPTAILRFDYQHPAAVAVGSGPGATAAPAGGDHDRPANDAAIRVLEHTLSVRQEKLGADHPDLVELLDALAKAKISRGALASARDHLEQARRILERPGGAARPAAIAGVLSKLGGVELSAERYESALGYLERALHLSTVHTPGADDLPRTKFAIARALRALDRDPDRRRMLAKQAHLAVANRRVRHRSLAAEISRWIINDGV